MASTSVVYARVDSELKGNAETILTNLGITPAAAISMLYSQVVLTGGIPFEIKLPKRVPTAIGGMSKEEIEAEIMKGIESAKERVYSLEEVERMLKDEFGL